MVGCSPLSQSLLGSQPGEKVDPEVIGEAMSPSFVLEWQLMTAGVSSRAWREFMQQPCESLSDVIG